MSLTNYDHDDKNDKNLHIWQQKTETVVLHALHVFCVILLLYISQQLSSNLRRDMTGLQLFERREHWHPFDSAGARITFQAKGLQNNQETIAEMQCLF